MTNDSSQEWGSRRTAGSQPGPGQDQTPDPSRQDRAAPGAKATSAGSLGPADTERHAAATAACAGPTAAPGLAAVGPANPTNPTNQPCPLSPRLRPPPGAAPAGRLALTALIVVSLAVLGLA